MLVQKLTSSVVPVVSYKVGDTYVPLIGSALPPIENELQKFITLARNNLFISSLEYVSAAILISFF